jgi:hypothetical protein
MAPAVNVVQISSRGRVSHLTVRGGAVAALSGIEPKHPEHAMRAITLLATSAVALAVGASLAKAAPQDVIDKVVEDLVAQGYVRIEIDIERNGGLDVDAYGGGRDSDFYFDREGNLLRVSSERDDDYGPGFTGQRVRIDDDRDDDDHRYDDYDDNDDDSRDDEDDSSDDSSSRDDNDDNDDDDDD